VLDLTKPPTEAETRLNSEASPQPA
jgi:hypothetical protein